MIGVTIIDGSIGGWGMKSDRVCPLCGGDMKEWRIGIYECEDCKNMIDIEVINEILGDDEE